MTVSPQKSTATDVVIRVLESEGDRRAFRELNEEWIRKFFTLEPKDVHTLSDPDGTILSGGGQILMAHLDGERIGCVALIPSGEGILELSKMAVAPSVRGLGIGRRLLLAAIDVARKMGAQWLFLGSSSTLKNAVHLYESVGFTHVPPDEIPPMPYARADVFMRLQL